MTMHERSKSDSIFYLNLNEVEQDVSTRGYMRLKVHGGTIKLCHVGDGVESCQENWDIVQEDKKNTVLLVVQADKPTPMTYRNEETGEERDLGNWMLLTKPIMQKELSLEELEIMRNGFNHMIEWIEQHQQKEPVLTNG